MVEHLPSIHEALGSIPAPGKIKHKGDEREDNHRCHRNDCRREGKGTLAYEILTISQSSYLAGQEFGRTLEPVRPISKSQLYVLT